MEPTFQQEEKRQIINETIADSDECNKGNRHGKYHDITQDCQNGRYFSPIIFINPTTTTTLGEEQLAVSPSHVNCYANASSRQVSQPKVTTSPSYHRTLSTRLLPLNYTPVKVLEPLKSNEWKMTGYFRQDDSYCFSKEMTTELKNERGDSWQSWRKAFQAKEETHVKAPRQKEFIVKSDYRDQCG